MYSDRERDRSHVTRNVNGKALQGAKFKLREDRSNPHAYYIMDAPHATVYSLCAMIRDIRDFLSWV